MAQVFDVRFYTCVHLHACDGRGAPPRSLARLASTDIFRTLQWKGEALTNLAVCQRIMLHTVSALLLMWDPFWEVQDAKVID